MKIEQWVAGFLLADLKMRTAHQSVQLFNVSF